MTDRQFPNHHPEPPASSNTKNANDLGHSKYALMGAIAGTVMEASVHPIDTVRTRIKSNTTEFVTFISQAKQMLHREGLKSYLRGLSATLVGASTSQGTYFYIYEKMKSIFKSSKWIPADIGPFMAGFIGGCIGDLIEIPCDLIRTRMQLEPGRYDYKHIFDAFNKIYYREGFTKLYHGGLIYVTLDALDTGLTFGFYELLHKALKPFFPSKQGDLNLGLSLCSSFSAASLTALLSNPLDVVVTRVQMINTAQEQPLNYMNLVSNMFQNEGRAGFFKGVSGRIGHYGLSAIILFPTYEYLKIQFGVDLSDA